MAKAITGSFTITQELRTNGQGYTTGVIPIGSLIDVGDAQALEIESVDYVYQSYYDTNQVFEVIHPGSPYAGDVSFGAQLMDRNAQTFLPAADNNLISSSAVNFDFANITTAATDFFPDDFQKTNGRFVVNDELYLTLYSSGVTASNYWISVSVRIRAKVVKLTGRDWMAISLETVQNE